MRIIPKESADHYTTQSKLREQDNRRELAIKLLIASSVIIGTAVVLCLILIAFGSLEPEKAVTLILAVSSIFSGLLGSAITYYFSR